MSSTDKVIPGGSLQRNLITHPNACCAKTVSLAAPDHTLSNFEVDVALGTQDMRSLLVIP